jgi:hypothetical protein
MRYAIVRGKDLWRVAEYLPDNYRVLGGVRYGSNNVIAVLVGGVDRAGWTLDEYVLPRLASGLLWGEEVVQEVVHHLYPFDEDEDGGTS